jgi:hypothetical protein
MDSTLTTALNKIDPTQGLIQYVQSVKPYHTKLLDVQVEFVYTDNAVGTALDSHTMDITQVSPEQEVVYADCGYGLIWDTDDSFANVPFVILAAEARTVEGGGDQNYFIIDVPASAEYTFFTTSQTSNQFRLTTPVVVTSANIALGILNVATDLSADLAPGDLVGFNIQRASGVTLNLQLTVASVTPTTVTVEESLPSLLQYPGTLHVFLDPSSIPAWITRHSSVTIVEPSTPPSPLIAGEVYFVNPSDTVPGLFNLATKRYPTVYQDYVDVTTPGTGVFNVQLYEPFAPGDLIRVDNTYLNVNDGSYTIREIVKVEGETTQWKIFVNEPITSSSGDLPVGTGIIYLNVDGYDDSSECGIIAAPDLYLRGRTTDVIRFEFGLSFDEDSEGTLVENPPQGGYSTMGFGSPDPWDLNDENRAQGTIVTTADNIVPAGFDTLYFDVSAFDPIPINAPNV